MHKYLFYGFACFAAVLFLCCGLQADPLVLEDEELAGVTGQSGVEVSEVVIGGLTIDLRDDDGRCDEDDSCEEDEGGSLNLSLSLPDSGFSSDNSLFVEEAMQLPDASNQILNSGSNGLIRTVNAVISIPASTSINMNTGFGGGFF